jgi:hypothetical protein
MEREHPVERPVDDPVAGEGVTQEAADSATQPDVDATNEG